MDLTGKIEMESVDLTPLADAVDLGEPETIDLSGMQTVEEATVDAILTIGDVADSTTN